MKAPLELLSAAQRSELRAADSLRWTPPMLATLVADPFSDPAWVFERKLDGERCLARRDGDAVRLWSRRRHRLDDTYPELLQPLGEASVERFVVDGEVVAFEGSLTSFTRLQRRMHLEDPNRARASGIAVYYYLFDVLYADGYDTTGLALRDRKRLLKAMFDYRDPLRYTPHRNEKGKALLEEACAKGWEGLIAKQAEAAYVSGRSRRWLKFKCVHRQEFVVGGFTEPEGKRLGFGALLLGYYEDGELTYAGKVGTGFDDATLRRLADGLGRREQRRPSFVRGDLPAAGVHWTAPELVAEIGFTEWTREGRLRHPRFLGLRRDKDPGDVEREVPQ